MDQEAVHTAMEESLVLRQGTDTKHGGEACHKFSMDFLGELGFPKDVFPLKDLEECGRIHETGFVWMKRKTSSEHYFKGTGTRVSYAPEVTAYVEKNKMKRIVGIKCRQMMLWLPITEMSIEDSDAKRIYVKTSLGIGRSFPFSAFQNDDEF
ncbi:hypothetical protein ZOSMA_77G00340 [Zostera marina]|uniref:DUF538 family protein n=1 Tax=Zostera marina TaxID=29655 RepID=A0A0K9NQW9_ZOSMR|nr:hypothetical protein ZOSMA_77G00340 [Zostera marina]